MKEISPKRRDTHYFQHLFSAVIFSLLFV